MVISLSKFPIKWMMNRINMILIRKQKSWSIICCLNLISTHLLECFLN